MNVKQAISLNLSADTIPARLHMMQGDSNSRTIVATLWDGAQPYSVPAGASVMLRFRKPDGTGGLYDTTEGGAKVTASGNTVTAPVATQMLAVAGAVRAQVDIYGTATGKRAEKLATFCFTIDVLPNAYADAEIISSDYYSIVAEQISSAVSSAASARESASLAQRYAEMASSASVSASVSGTKLVISTAGQVG